MAVFFQAHGLKEVVFQKMNHIDLQPNYLKKIGLNLKKRWPPKCSA